ncbi:MAG: oligosaccharide repeat unit polymerase [Bacteroides sp.]|uniref:Oligosaccharide repeat unit polymerase n=1 Tax=Phocaeicola sartorii TaxID=671267 RepID=R9IBP5_9BACT|nr:O-antigen polymerase [Phocaeicola sartorii]EOS14905.1 hypothetical protein C802_00922 [Phocaeicola sartorii]MBO5506794.1 oligosaccharide repeat unit polymerase [Bacteroides sp.]MCR1846680.1 oligosaccharide repeat unit polymerase [Phocaeicola sartorii]NUL01309.1 oligosaccharide repeat unit polymerase [Phocaeicola sartorii]
MTGYVVLVLIELLLLWIAYRTLKDILAPAFISIFTFLCSTLLCLPMVSMWEMVVYKETVTVVTLGLLCMILACRLNMKPRTRKSYSPVLNYIDVPSGKSVLLIIVCVWLTFYYIYAVVKAGQSIGADGGLEAITAVKQADDVEVDFVAKQGVKVVFALSYVHLYLFVNNVVNKSCVGKEMHHLIPSVCLFLCCIFTGVRTDMLKLVSAGLFMTILLMRYKKNKLGRFMRRILIGIIVVAFAGGALNTLNKGEGASINNAYSIGQIVAYYIGSPIQVLNMKLKDGTENYRDKTIWGRTTFSRQYIELDRFGIYKTKIGDKKGSMNVMLDERNNVVANVDTILGPPLIDFGLCGMLLYIFLLYWGISWCYYDKVQRTSNPQKKAVNIILYSFFVVIPVMAYYACLPNLILTFPYLVEALIIYMICKFYFRQSLFIQYHD